MRLRTQTPPRPCGTSRAGHSSPTGANGLPCCAGDTRVLSKPCISWRAKSSCNPCHPLCNPPSPHALQYSRNAPSGSGCLRFSNGLKPSFQSQARQPGRQPGPGGKGAELMHNGHGIWQKLATTGPHFWKGKTGSRQTSWRSRAACNEHHGTGRGGFVSSLQNAVSPFFVVV